jgi:phosphoribosyl 1,2-cyclic phosphodiesterase
MQVTFWGARGSVPTPHARTLKYGGNTSCVEVRTPAGHTIILDCGTGIMHLGKLLAERTPPEGHKLMVFLTHFHWDHIQGLPFFAPLYDIRNQVFFHCFEAHGFSGKEALGALMLTPYFPVDMSVMKARKNFYTIGEERLKVFDVEISSKYLNHPQGCLGFRVDSEDGVFVYGTDHEHGVPEFDANMRTLAEGADLLVYDAQYTPAEYQTHVGWGHSTWEEGIRVARDADVRELVLFHHDPDHSDLFLDKMLIEARACSPRVHAAMEGTTVSIQRRQKTATFRSSVEQRQSQRVPLPNPIRVRLQRIGDDEVEQTMLNDLSLDGSFFMIDHEWDIGTELDVEIQVPAGQDHPASVLRLRGMVARSEKVNDKTGIGVTFRSRGIAAEKESS